MIPLRDYNPTKRPPVLTLLFIAVNTLVFVQDRLTGHMETTLVSTARGWVEVEQFIGGFSAHYALIPANLVGLPADAWPTIFTSMFLHGNWLHIASNMLYLWIFGDNIEDSLGRLRFLFFYFMCGFIAALTQVASAPLSNVPMVGASGAVAGVMGAYLILYPHARVLTFVPFFFFFTTIDVPAFLIIGWWAFIQFANAAWMGGGELARGGVAWFAHIGGFLAGMGLLLLVGGKRLRR